MRPSILPAVLLLLFLPAVLADFSVFVQVIHERFDKKHIPTYPKLIFFNKPPTCAEAHEVIGEENHRVMYYHMDSSKTGWTCDDKCPPEMGAHLWPMERLEMNDNERRFFDRNEDQSTHLTAYKEKNSTYTLMADGKRMGTCKRPWADESFHCEGMEEETEFQWLEKGQELLRCKSTIFIIDSN